MKVTSIMFVALLFALAASPGMASGGAPLTITMSTEATALEHYAAGELRR